MIEEFHKDGKALGLGEYQTRDEVMPLIHGVSLIFAYTLLAKMARESRRMFGEIVKTIGECSRLLKKLLFFKKGLQIIFIYGVICKTIVIKTITCNQLVGLGKKEWMHVEENNKFDAKKNS